MVKRTETIDAVITDVHLPGMSGLQATARIKAMAPVTQVVIAYTIEGVFGRDDRVKDGLRKLGVDDAARDGIDPNSRPGELLDCDEYRYLQSQRGRAGRLPADVA